MDLRPGEMPFQFSFGVLTGCLGSGEVRESDVWLNKANYQKNLGKECRLPIGCLVDHMIGYLYCHVIVVYFTSKSPTSSSVKEHFSQGCFSHCLYEYLPV